MATSMYQRGSGWLLFASIIMMTAGIMRILDALWAFDRNDEIDDLDVVVFNDNLSAYGWTWLVIGVLLIVAGAAVMTGSEMARWFGILMAAIAAVSSMLWIYEFPIWAMVNTLIACLVLYGLAAYGGREAGRSGLA